MHVWSGSFQCRAESLDDCRDATACRSLFKDQEWAGYIAGCLIVLKREGYIVGGIPGCRLFLASDVPEGKGVSSSACVEVAAMKAMAAALRLDIDDVTLAQLCQKVENEIVGASCGIMDQMTAMMGEKGKLMKLLCQPCALLGHVSIQQDLTIIGIDSGERHSITGSDYATIRTATFMGLKIMKNELKRDIPYLVDIPLDAIEASSLPESLEGQVFIERYGAHVDASTEIRPEMSYSVRSATRHPIEEIQRVRRFSALLESPDGRRRCGNRFGDTDACFT